jgi:hypothetical protein
MVRAMVLGPVVAALESCGEDTESFLASFQTTPEVLGDPKTYIHNDVAYRVFEAAAKLRDDPSFCASVGRSIDLSQFLPCGAALKDALTIGDFIYRFTHAEASDSTTI